MGKKNDEIPEMLHQDQGVESPESNLMHAILNQAINDSKRSGKIGREARDYIFSEDIDEHLYSFESICVQLNLSEKHIRNAVLEMLIKESD